MTPLVLLHGFTGSAASWDDVVAALPGVHSVRPALLGHAPESDAARAVRTWSDEIARLGALLPPEPVHLVGYSLGARLALALALALRSPGRLTHLTLIS